MDETAIFIGIIFVTCAVILAFIVEGQFVDPEGGDKVDCVDGNGNIIEGAECYTSPGRATSQWGDILNLVVSISLVFGMFIIVVGLHA